MSRRTVALPPRRAPWWLQVATDRLEEEHGRSEELAAENRKLAAKVVELVQMLQVATDRIYELQPPPRGSTPEPRGRRSRAASTTGGRKRAYATGAGPRRVWS